MASEKDDIKFVTMRVEDSPEAAVPSTMIVCDRCGQAVWVDVGNVATAEKPEVEVVCNRCIVPDLAASLETTKALVGGTEIELPEELAAELRVWALERELRREV